MADVERLLSDVLATPLDHGPRRAFAAAASGPIQELIELQLALFTATPAKRAAMTEQSARVRDLIAEHGRRWADGVADHATRWTFDRGFVGSITIDAPTFMAIGNQLLTAHPILMVELENAERVNIDKLAQTAAFAGVLGLKVTGAQWTSDHAIALANSPYMQGLQWLDLSNNAISFHGAEALAEKLRELRWLHMLGNEVSPTPEPGQVYKGRIQGWRPNPYAEAFEKLHGYRAWMSCDVWREDAYPPTLWDLADIGTDGPGIHLLRATQVVRRAGGAPRVLLAKGPVGPRARARRIGVFAVDGDGLELRVDARLVPEQEELLASLFEAAGAEVLAGAWDVGVNTGWDYTWSDAPFTLWHRTGLRARVEDGALVGTPDVEAVVVQFPANLSKATLGVRSKGEVVALIEQDNPTVMMDPAYDAMDFEGEFGWLSQVGRALAASLGLPLEDGFA